jgi:cyclopropane-fatty-acyl-phospholipid synthase
MSAQHQQALTRSFGSERLAQSGSFASKLLSRFLGNLEHGGLVVETPTKDRLMFGGRRPGPQARVTIHSWRLLGRLVFGWDVGFAEAYMAGEWSSPDLASLLKLACNNRAVVEPLKTLRAPRAWLRLRHAMNRNTQPGSRRNIAAHYDLGNQFYERWLDAGMAYSSGLFSSGDQTLEEAQDAKLDRVVSLLDLSGGESVLEIGCGWGSLAQRLLDQHDCTLTGITLSAEQLAYGRRRLNADVMAGRCDLRLQDYRDVHGTFERIVSIEMLEAVGEAYWPTYFAKLRDSLSPDGIAVLQAITIDQDRFENYRRRPDFIQKYIFPGGMLPTTQIIEREARRAGLQVVANEFFGESYARTVEQWKLRFQDSWPDIKALGFDQRFKRMWEYYLAYCQAGFETRAVNVGLYKIARAEGTPIGKMQPKTSAASDLAFHRH